MSRFRSRLKALDPKPGHVALFSERANTIVLMRLDDGYPSPEGGYGGWEDEPRPGQLAATVFRGSTPQRLPLRVILGGWPVDPRLGGLTCRQQIDKLEKLARPLQPGRGHRPPLLRVRGGVRHHGVRWFIDELTWGDVIVGNRRIMRAQATVTLKRFAGIEFARVPERPLEPQRHKVRKGERPGRIVRDVLGITDPREIKAVVKMLQWGEGRRRGKTIRDPSKIEQGDWIILPVVIG